MPYFWIPNSEDPSFVPGNMLSTLEAGSPGPTGPQRNFGKVGSPLWRKDELREFDGSRLMWPLIGSYMHAATKEVEEPPPPPGGGDPPYMTTEVTYEIDPWVVIKETEAFECYRVGFPTSLVVAPNDGRALFIVAPGGAPGSFVVAPGQFVTNYLTPLALPTCSCAEGNGGFGCGGGAFIDWSAYTVAFYKFVSMWTPGGAWVTWTLLESGPLSAYQNHVFAVVGSSQIKLNYCPGGQCKCWARKVRKITRTYLVVGGVQTLIWEVTEHFVQYMNNTFLYPHEEPNPDFPGHSPSSPNDHCSVSQTPDPGFPLPP